MKTVADGMNGGRVFAYEHNNGYFGAMVIIRTETDFASRTEEFKTFGKNIVMQIAAMDPQSVEELLDQPWIGPSGGTIRQLLQLMSETLGEKVDILEFKRFAL